MKHLKGAGICPCVKKGDRVYADRFQGTSKRKTVSFIVERIIFNSITQGCCKAYKNLALVLGEGKGANPGNLNAVDCSQCPVLAKNPKSKEESLDYVTIMSQNNPFHNDKFKEWLDNKVAIWTKKVHDLEALKEYDLDERNEAAGYNNGYSVCSWNIGTMDKEDYIEEIKGYAKFRSKEDGFGRAIKQACEESLAMLESIERG